MGRLKGVGGYHNGTVTDYRRDDVGVEYTLDRVCFGGLETVTGERSNR